jgi:hypothetical protein
MRSMSRATVLFGIVLGLFVVFGFVTKNIFHLDCVGPYLPGWGCLAQPIPNSVDEVAVASGSLLHYVAAALVIFAVCYLVRDAIFLAAGFVVRRLFPRNGRDDVPQPQHYRYR